MRTPAQRGPIGNWLRDERLARGWSSAAQVRGHLERAGIHVAASVYAEWESGTRLPSERHLEQLQAFYGSKPATSAPGQDAVAAAIREQTAMMAELVAELRRLRGVHEGLSDGLGEVLGALMGGAAGTQSPRGTHTGSGKR